jgi:hypothetical protein
VSHTDGPTCVIDPADLPLVDTVLPRADGRTGLRTLHRVFDSAETDMARAAPMAEVRNPRVAVGAIHRLLVQ